MLESLEAKYFQKSLFTTVGGKKTDLISLTKPLLAIKDSNDVLACIYRKPIQLIQSSLSELSPVFSQAAITDLNIMSISEPLHARIWSFLRFLRIPSGGNLGFTFWPCIVEESCTPALDVASYYSSRDWTNYLSVINARKFTATKRHISINQRSTTS